MAPRLGLGPDEVDVEQAVVQGGRGHLDALGQDEAALELARRDAAVEIGAVRVVRLLAVDHQLVVLDADLESGGGEAGHRQGDAQAAVVDLLDVVGRIAVGRGLRHALDHALEMIETKKQWAVE